MDIRALIYLGVLTSVHGLKSRKENIANTQEAWNARFIDLQYQFNNLFAKYTDLDAELSLVKQENKILSERVLDLEERNTNMTITQAKLKESVMKLETRVKQQCLWTRKIPVPAKIWISDYMTEEDWDYTAIESVLYKKSSHSMPRREFTIDSKRRLVPFSQDSASRFENVTDNQRQRRTTGTQRPSAAFHATLSSTLRSPGVGQRIKFDKVLNNEGNSYSGKTGIFTCSTPGLYIFFVTIVTLGPSSYIEAELVRNGIAIAYIVADGVQHVSSGSTTSIVQLDVGDTVWIRVVSDLDNSGNIDSFYSTFTGYIL